MNQIRSCVGLVVAPGGYLDLDAGLKFLESLAGANLVQTV